MKKTFYENYIKDNEGIILLTILTIFVIAAVIMNFTKLDGGKISNNFNERSDYCRDLHNGVLKETTVKDSDNSASYTMNLCTDADDKVYVDELPSESILRGGEWFEKCRSHGDKVYYYTNNINSQKSVNDKNKLYICSDDKNGKVLSAYKDLDGSDVQVG